MPRKRDRLPQVGESVEFDGLVHRVASVHQLMSTYRISNAQRTKQPSYLRYKVITYCDMQYQRHVLKRLLRVRKSVGCIDCVVRGA